jgi:two-component system response regulator FixJ
MRPQESLPLVCVVDDDADCRDSLRWLVESAGYRVDAYPSAEAFLGACSAAVACCLVLDVRLPGMSGLDLQGDLLRAGRGLPLIFVTGHGDSRMEAAALANGARDFLHKPFDDERLLASIERAVTEVASQN